MKPARAFAIRRSEPITCYVGGNGHGKTLAMIYDTIPALNAGRTVLSTCKLLDPASPLVEVEEFVTDPITGLPRTIVRLQHRDPHPCYVPLVSWRQLVEAEHCDVLMDEIVAVASARQHSLLPHQVETKSQQLRKSDVTIRWTSPNFARADLVLRELTRLVTDCRGYVRRPVPGRSWPERSWFRLRTYNASDLDAFEAGQVDKLRVEARQWLHRNDAFMASQLYWTLDAVTTLDHTDGAGLCLTCNGRRVQPKCTCPPPGVQLSRVLESMGN